MASPVVSALLDAARTVVGADPQQLDAGTLVEDLSLLGEVDNILAAAQTRLLSAAADRDATVDVCGRSPRSWLVEEQLLDPREASRRIQLMHGLTAYAETAAALTAGDVSAAHAHVIIGALRHVPEDLRQPVEQALLELARVQPPFIVARAVDEILVRLGVEHSSDEAAARRYARRGVDVASTFGGTGSLSGTLSPSLTEKLSKLFADCAAPLGPEDERRPAQRRHDLLEDVVDDYLGRSDQPEDSGHPARVIVTIPLETLENELSTAWGTLDSGVKIAPATARRLACDAEVIPAVLGARGDVLDLGVASRTFSTAVRRAARLRDGARCGFPRCRRPIKECHHIVWWSRGGRSSLDNAVWLCAFHHWLAHEGGWQLTRDGDGGRTWTSPHGEHVRGDPPRHPRAA